MSVSREDRLETLRRTAGSPAFAEGELSSASSDSIGRYPTNSKTACYNSLLLATDEGADSATIERLRKFAAFWGISNTVDDGLKKIAAAQKPEHVSDDDLLLCQEFNGTLVRKYAAFDRGSCTAAATAFYENRYRYPYAWRKTAAVRALAKAQEYGAVLPEYVERYLQKAAGWGAPTVDAVNDAIVSRYAATIREVDARELEQLQDTMVKVASSPYTRLDQDVVDAMIQGLDAFDAQYKLAAHYGVGVELPEEMLTESLDSLKKFASAAQRVVKLQNGKSVDIVGIRKEALALVDEDLSKMSLDKLAAVLPTLPRPDADMLTRNSPEAFSKTAADMSALITAGTTSSSDAQTSTASAADTLPPPPGVELAPQPQPAGVNGPIEPETEQVDDLLSAVQAP